MFRTSPGETNDNGTPADDLEADESESDDDFDDDRRGRVALGQEGWRVCLLMGLCPMALPCRASSQHKNILALYPVESAQPEKKVSVVCCCIHLNVIF